MVKVIVSITSFGKKMNDLLPKVLFLLRKQTFKDFKICLTLNKEDYDILENVYLQNLIETKEIDLIIADKHLKPHLKYFYAMQKYKDLPIITLDDDTIYPDTTIEELYDDYIKNGNDFIYARKVSEINHSNKWCSGSREIKPNEAPNHKFFAEGYCGILYPPNVFDEFYNDSDELKKIEDLVCDDDVYLKGLEIRKNRKVKHTFHKSENCKGQMDLGNEYEKFSLHKQFNSVNERIKNLLKIRSELNSIGVK